MEREKKIKSDLEAERVRIIFGSHNVLGSEFAYYRDHSVGLDEHSVP